MRLLHCSLLTKGLLTAVSTLATAATQTASTKAGEAAAISIAMTTSELSGDVIKGGQTGTAGDKVPVIAGRRVNFTNNMDEQVLLEIAALGSPKGKSVNGWISAACTWDRTVPCLQLRVPKNTAAVPFSIDELGQWLLPDPVVIHFSVEAGFPPSVSRADWFPYWDGKESSAKPSVLQVTSSGLWRGGTEAAMDLSIVDADKHLRPIVIRNVEGPAEVTLFVKVPDSTTIDDVKRSSANGFGELVECGGGLPGRCLRTRAAVGTSSTLGFGSLIPGSQESVQIVVVAADGRMLSEVVSVPRLRPSAGTRANDAQTPEAEIELSEFGGSRLFRSPRSTPLVSDGPSAFIRFSNITVDRTFLLEATFTDPQKSALRLAQGSGFTATAAGTTVTIKATVGAGASVDVPVEALTGDATLVEFKLAYEFALEAGPVNRSVWIRVSEGKDSLASAWDVSGSLGFASRRTPDFTAFTPELPYADAALSDNLGEAEVRTSRRLNEWLEVQMTANGDVPVGNGSARNAKVSSATLRFYGAEGYTITAGRVAWLKPADGLAINLFGDVVHLSAPVKYLQSLNMGFMLVSESGTGVPDKDNLDHYRIGGEIGPFGRRRGSGLRSITLTGVLGKDKKKDLRYWTAGSTVRFGTTAGVVSGSLAGFLSGQSGSVRGNGWSWMGTVDWGLPEAGTKKIARVVQLRAAQGKADDLATSDDEGLVGPTSAFSTGGFFLPSLSGKFDLRNGTAGHQLDNMTFVSFGFTDNAWSPLEWLAGLLQVPATGKRIQFKYHIYRLRQLTPSHDQRALGSELLLSMGVTAPEKLEWTLDLASFTPAGQFDRRFDKLPIRAVFRMKAKF